MTTTSTDDLRVEVTPDPADEAAARFAERLFGQGLAALELATVDLGLRLDLYSALRGQAMTPGDLAARRGIAPRYAREWLEQQAVAGVLVCQDPAADADGRRYLLEEPVAWCLLEPEHPSYLAAFACFPGLCSAQLPAVADAFRSGGGVPYAAYALHDAQGEQNRPVFANELESWLDAVDGLTEALRRPGAHAAEIGCGVGWAAIRLGELFPELHVDGFDADVASVRQARRHAAERGLHGRVRFAEADVTDPDLDAGPYDLVLAVEMVHDLAAPVEALAAMGRLAGPDGAVLVVDERVADEFDAPGDELERVFYAFSVLHCLPVGMAEPGSAATGTVMRPAVLRSYAEQAGFRAVETVDLGSDFFRGYLLA